ncbi:hypothetical protein [Carboxylicivirga caseinilyticus]|uniref:hypothetical protein n=1 Tax=Carboxylicivirga caseinilyticus TaxID=3417572 RepID=UPI003D33FBC9|nr:hypothetical protein [Marinilabiliaceae bacterium A049]
MTIKTNIILSAFLALILLVNGAYLWTAIGLGLALFYTLKVIDRMGQRIPIVDLMTAMAALQWIVGPAIDYYNEAYHYKYHMYVEEMVYMSFVVPAIIVFRIGTLMFKDHSSLEDIGNRVSILLGDYPKLPYYFIVIGLLIPYFSGFLPASLSFVFFLLANIKYIGVIYLLFSGKPNRWPIFWATMAFTAVVSIAAGMFHDLLLWAMLSFTFVARELKLTFINKLGVAVLGIFFAVTIQSVKAQYREMVWKQGYSGNKVALFLGLATSQWSDGSILTPSTEEDMNVRLNQGWIISAVMKNTNEKESFAGGATIWEGIESSLLPRFLAPNKKKAGGREHFRLFTGLEIDDNTSMGISIVGEGYANYGYWGGIFFMFFWGVFISWFWKKLEDWSSFYPTLLIWSPILFLQVVKAETEFAVVLNHLIKASVLVFGLLWFIKRQWGIRI